MVLLHILATRWLYPLRLVSFFFLISCLFILLFLHLNNKGLFLHLLLLKIFGVNFVVLLCYMWIWRTAHILLVWSVSFITNFFILIVRLLCSLFSILEKAFLRIWVWFSIFFLSCSYYLDWSSSYDPFCRRFLYWFVEPYWFLSEEECLKSLLEVATEILLFSRSLSFVYPLSSMRTN